MNLKQIVARLEDGIIVLSGPALAISGIIAGVDLVTGGNILRNLPGLTLTWAITLLLTLDFQVLALGVRAHRAAVSTKAVGWRALEIAALVVVAAGISAVSIQMQSIIAVINAETITINQAAAQLGISMIALTWERSTLVLVLIFMSGWLREEGKPITTATPALQGTPAVHVQMQAPAPLQSAPQALLPEKTSVANDKPIFQGQFASKEQLIADLLREAPSLSDQELAARAGCHIKTAAKWSERYRKGLTA